MIGFHFQAEAAVARGKDSFEMGLDGESWTNELGSCGGC